MMTLAHVKQLDLQMEETNIGAQRSDGLSLKTFGMVIANFHIVDKLDRVCFFQKTFLLGKISIEVVLGMPFLILSNTDI